MQPKLTFLGAAQNVTGSCYLVEADGLRILVDCGLYQERDYLERNWDVFPVEPSSIDALLLTHAHLDHSGLIPKLVRDGFSGKIYCTEATAEIADVVLLDSANLQEEDVLFKRKRHKKEGRQPPRPEVPLYTIEDAKKCAGFFSPVRYEEVVPLRDEVLATFHDAGHILGAAMIKLTVGAGSGRRTIVFSGDVGRWDRPILRDPTVFEQADYVLIESTYGDRLHKSAVDTDEEFAEVINTTVKAGGNIVIPSFAVERAQEVLYSLNKLLLAGKINPVPVFLDSPMALHVTEIFKKHPELFDDEMAEMLYNNESPFGFDGLGLVETTKGSQAINNVRGSTIIIAGSGMCTGGRVKHHLVNNISRAESTIVFVGYQASGTLGRRIVDGEKEVRILGRNYPVRAKVARLNGFSAHADRDELYRWIGGLKNRPRRVFVVHGETKSAKSFRDFLEEKTAWECSVPGYRDEFVLE